jgi:hypothetical protein
MGRRAPQLTPGELSPAGIRSVPPDPVAVTATDNWATRAQNTVFPRARPTRSVITLVAWPSLCGSGVPAVPHCLEWRPTLARAPAGMALPFESAVWQDRRRSCGIPVTDGIRPAGYEPA